MDFMGEGRGGKCSWGHLKELTPRKGGGGMDFFTFYGGGGGCDIIIA